MLAGSSPVFARRSMAACSTGGKIVLFGGVGAAGTESILDVANDCWTFDPEAMTWRELIPGEPMPSPRRCVGIVATAGGLSVWGGSGVTETPAGLRYTFLNDWWDLDLAAEKWTRLRESDDHLVAPLANDGAPYPSPRYTPVFHRVNETLFLFSGYTEDRLGKRKLNDVWLHDGSAWSEVVRTGDAGYDDAAAWPGERYGSASAASGDRIFVFGGFSDVGDHNDLWEFDPARRRWRLLSPESPSSAVPLARYCSAFACHDDKLFLFGGRSRRNPRANYNDVWRFDVRSSRWECVSPNRAPHVYDASAEFPGYHAKTANVAAGRHWYIWGGEGLHGHVSDFWRFSFSTGEWEFLQAARPDDPRFW